MMLYRKVILYFLFSFCLKAYSQPGYTDSTCAKIDSLSSSFEKFSFRVNYPKVAVGNRIHYVDTLNKAYKKIVFESELDTLTKIFYFQKDLLIEIKVTKNTDAKQTAKYQFESGLLSYKWDPGQIVKNITALTSEGKRYFGLVRYKYR